MHITKARVWVEVNHVGRLPYLAKPELAKPFCKCFSSCMIRVQLRQYMIQRPERGSSKHTGLSHAAAQQFAGAAGLIKNLARAHQTGPYRRAQTLRQAH